MATRYDGTKAEVSALNAFIALQRAADSVEAATQAEIARSGLTQSRFGVLEALLHLGPLTPKELAGKLLRSKGNLTLVIENLEREGLTSREPSKEDGRSFTVNLTAKGRKRIASMFPKHAKLITSALSSLSSSEQEDLRRLCRKLGKAQTKGGGHD
ncbi:MAG: MarR family transcriptional regulator [Elusimicrobiota bacterium]|nr:MAG: MarR family transcriptional regulator [Elusimicrobiota bacterium]